MMSQVAPGLNGPTAPTNVALGPSISHIAAVPSSPCQMMSDLPSPLKSPVPLISQFGPGLNPTRPTAPTNVALGPFADHTSVTLPCPNEENAKGPQERRVPLAPQLMPECRPTRARAK